MVNLPARHVKDPKFKSVFSHDYRRTKKKLSPTRKTVDCSSLRLLEGIGGRRPKKDPQNPQNLQSQKPEASCMNIK